MTQIERRYVPAAEATLELEERSAAAPVIKGVSPPWNSKSVDLGGFREVFAPEAFDRILGRHRNDPRGGVDVVALFNHDDNQVLGRTTAGTLELSKTTKGMAYSITPPDTTLGRDLLTLLRRGDISGASFAFSVSEGGEKWSVDDDGKDLRTITEVAGLYDVSVVTRPAYPESSAALRSLQAWKAAAAAEPAPESASLEEIAQSVEQLEQQRRRWSYAISAAGAKLLNMRLKAYAARIK